jgi:hypothetical protein
MPSALYTELTTGPLASQIAPYLAVRNDAAIADLLNAKNYTKPGWISVAKFNTWCAANNAEYANIESLASNSASPYYAAAKSLLRCLNGAVTDGAINLEDAIVMGLVNAWPFVNTSGTSAEKAALIAAGTFPASRAEVLSMDCSLNAISHTLNNGGN